MKFGINRSTILLLSAILAIPASFASLWLFAGDLWTLPWNNDPTEVAQSIRQDALPVATPPPEFEDLEAFLRYAKSIPVSSERDQGLRTVAEFAVREGNYEIAIEAGTSSPSSSEGAKTLSFVSLCAAEEGLYETAYRAASNIRISSVESTVKRELLNIRNRRSSAVAPSIDERDVGHCFQRLLE